MVSLFDELPSMNSQLSPNKSFDLESAELFLSHFIALADKHDLIHETSEIVLALDGKVYNDSFIVKVNTARNFHISRVLSLFDFRHIKFLFATGPDFLHGLSVINYLVVKQFSDEAVRSCYALMLFIQFKHKLSDSKIVNHDMIRHFAALNLLEKCEESGGGYSKSLNFNYQIDSEKLAGSVDEMIFYYKKIQNIEQPLH